VPPAPAGRQPAIDIDEQIDFQRRSWLAQRVSWVIMALLLGAATVGFFGMGPLSRTRVTVGSNVSVEYHKWIRVRAPTELRFQVGETAAEPTRLHLSHSLLSGLRIDRIEPEPSWSRADPDGIGYEFRVRGPAPVVFYVRAEQAGRVIGRIRAGDGAPVELPFLVWP
jgi:hypothetical protein